jgi:hypothetical protein
MFPALLRRCGCVLFCVFFFCLFGSSLCRAQTGNDVALLGAFNMTRPSAGQFVSGPSAGDVYNQTSRSAFGVSAEYQRWWSKNGFVFAYSRTPTDSTLLAADSPPVRWQLIPAQSLLISPDGQDAKWKLSRNEFNILYARRFRSSWRNSPRLMAGVTPILLNGGKASGFDHQFAPVVGAANDFRISTRLSLRCEFFANFLRASNFSDNTYVAGHTVMFESRFGPVFRFGSAPSH